MKFLSVSGKTLKEVFRDRRNLLLGLGLPVAFMLIFGFAFGGSSNTTYEVAVLNEDGGALSQAFVKALEGANYSDGQKIFKMLPVSSVEEGRNLVQRNDANVFVSIPRGFTGNRPVEVTLHGDPSSGASQTASGIVKAILADPRFSGSTRVTTEEETVTASELTRFDFIAPGLMVFSVINLAPQAAALLAREVENKTLTRLRLTRMQPVDLLAGVSLAQIVVGALAFVLMFATALLMGFHIESADQLLLALGVCAVAALAVMGVGMVLASFATRQEHAAGLGVLVSVPASFLSGAFFPIPEVPLFRLGERVVEIYDILPTTHAVQALRQVLTLGNGLEDVVFELTALVVLSVLYFAVGVVLFRRAHLRPL
ncbi:MAG TPA: ABC transporter permease [Candidatus Thermoplasmatota archaeon]|nr:ABC transporter permease [Candidatus Thermoplasmatota archaeon]